MHLKTEAAEDYDSPVWIEVADLALRELVRQCLRRELMESLGTYDLDLDLEQLLKLRRAEVDKIERLWQRD